MSSQSRKARRQVIDETHLTNMAEAAVFAKPQSAHYRELERLSNQYLDTIGAVAREFLGRTSSPVTNVNGRVEDELGSTLRIRVQLVKDRLVNTRVWFINPDIAVMRRVQRLMGWPERLNEVAEKFPNSEIAFQMAWFTDDGARERLLNREPMYLHRAGKETAGLALYKLLRDSLLLELSPEALALTAIYVARNLGCREMLEGLEGVFRVKLRLLTDDTLQQLALMGVSRAGLVIAERQRLLAMPSFCDKYVIAEWCAAIVALVAESKEEHVRNDCGELYAVDDLFGRKVDPLSLYFPGMEKSDLSYRGIVTWAGEKGLELKPAIVS